MKSWQNTPRLSTSLLRSSSSLTAPGFWVLVISVWAEWVSLQRTPAEAIGYIADSSGISRGKLNLYTAGGGIDPERTLAVVLE